MERTVAMCGAFSILCIALIMGWNAVNNPMDKRRAELEADVGEVKPARSSYGERTDLDSQEIRATILSKPNLWRQLITPPPVKKTVVKPPAPPDLAKMLRGVTVTRQGFGKGEKMKAQIKTPENPRGGYMAVGDKVMGTTILKIEKDSVLFGFNKGKKRFTKELPRK